MGRAANFTVVFDEKRTQGFDDLSGIEFTLPDEVDIDANTILVFMLQIGILEDQIKLEVKINDKSVYHATFDDEVDKRYTSVQEIVSPKVLRRGRNSISFTTQKPSGDSSLCEVSDVVLWWHENV